MKKFLLFLAGLFIPLVVFAQETILTPPVGQGILPGTAALDTDFKTGIVFAKVIPFVIRFGIGLAMVLAVFAIVLGGYQYMTAYGNEEKHDKARKIITFAIVGLVVAMMAYSLVTVVTRFRFGLDNPTSFIPAAYADEQSDFVDHLEDRQNQVQASYDALELRIDSMEGSDPRKKELEKCPEGGGVYLCKVRDAVDDFKDLSPSDAAIADEVNGGFKASEDFETKERIALEAIQKLSVALVTPRAPANVPTGDLIDDFIPAAIRLLFRFAWVAVFISFLYSGVLMVITYDNEERTTKAKQMLYYSLLGFAFVTLAFTIVKAVTDIDFFGFV